jgi:hypothetical protein
MIVPCTALCVAALYLADATNLFSYQLQTHRNFAYIWGFSMIKTLAYIGVSQTGFSKRNENSETNYPLI